MTVLAMGTVYGTLMNFRGENKDLRVEKRSPDRWRPKIFGSRETRGHCVD